MKRYEPKQLEPKWQRIWDDTKLYEAHDDDPRPKHYQLEYFPYPSGVTMHVGHVRNYVISDAFVRYQRMSGRNVLHPMGWDAFGLPAENQAIKTGKSPRESTEENIKIFKRQLSQVGLSYDWSREINSSEPDYYRWTQWLFLLMHKRGLAYKAKAAVNWCPVDKTVLANEQVIKKDGKNVCERCGSLVEKRQLSQWFLKITEYADRLLDDLDELDWPENIKAMQRNWIGRSIGAVVTFKIKGSAKTVPVFTTRHDTQFGVTFMVLAPEHPLVDKITPRDHRAKVDTFVKQALNKSEIERMSEKEDKVGIFTGAYAINPVNNEEIPIWIADYVL
ncbi:MAG TPA: class I tRNA ligase family protein, partial [Candidatus Polarisedimenticolaceae bacterium]|nr:class I tRNA ligase family protein [Candidatus Polarisedimenticolaceae bacterium]